MTNRLTERMTILESESSLIEGFEPSAKEKHYYIRGKFATIGAINNNGRVYSRALWEKEVARYQTEIENGTINTLMEWDHPADRLEVDPSQAIAKITRLWIDGDFVMGEAIIFDVPKAETLKSLIKYNVQMSVSSRGRGRASSDGVVQTFELITFDFVAKPSDTAATMYGIFENLNKGNIMNDELLENMVNMVRAKDLEIQDLKDEVAIWKTELNESKGEINPKESQINEDGLQDFKREIRDWVSRFDRMSESNSTELETLRDEFNLVREKVEDRMDESKADETGAEVWKERYLSQLKNNKALKEAAIGNFELDDQVISRKDFSTDMEDESNEFAMRGAAENLAQTHRHQDVSLLNDTDPASLAYSGEDEVTRIARLLMQVFGRHQDVGTVLDKDVDNGQGLSGDAAAIEDYLRHAENGLDGVQLRNLGMMESNTFISK